MDSHANFAYSTVAVAPVPTATGPTLYVETGDGAAFPAVPFNAVICPAGASPMRTNAEVVRVTGRAGDQLSITRAQEGSAARAVQVGDQVFAAITAKTLTDIELAVIPIGGEIAYAGVVLPPGGAFDWADGGLIDRTVYAAFYATVLHTYNGGVDPGSNRVRKPDKRGAVSVGADNMGTGAAGRLTGNRAVGQRGGEERHQLTAPEIAAHIHGVQRSADGTTATNIIGPIFRSEGGTGTDYFTTQSAGLDQPHNTMQPYEVDSVIVRIA